MTEKCQNLMQLQTVISGTFLKLSESFKCSKYSSGTQLSNGTQHMGLRITPCDPRVILRGALLGVCDPYDGYDSER